MISPASLVAHEALSTFPVNFRIIAFILPRFLILLQFCHTNTCSGSKCPTQGLQRSFSRCSPILLFGMAGVGSGLLFMLKHIRLGRRRRLLQIFSNVSSHLSSVYLINIHRSFSHIFGIAIDVWAFDAVMPLDAHCLFILDVLTYSIISWPTEMIFSRLTLMTAFETVSYISRFPTFPASTSAEYT